MVSDDLKMASVKTLYLKLFFKNCRQNYRFVVEKAILEKQNILESVFYYMAVSHGLGSTKFTNLIG